MSNEMILVGAIFHIRREQEEAAKVALREAASIAIEKKDMRAGDIQAMIDGTPEGEIELLTLDQLVRCWGWSLLRDHDDETGEIVGITLLEDFSSDEETLFEVFGPFVAAGSYIDLEGKRFDGYWKTRFAFTGQQVVALEPTFPPLPSSLPQAATEANPQAVRPQTEALEQPMLLIKKEDAPMQDVTPADYSSLVNEEALFERYIKRAFTGQIEEVLAELLQNSQRAHASRVDIRCYEQGWWEYSDNGHGLVDGIASLHTLLRWGESHYQDQNIDQNQHPMGVGLYALICQKDIHSIRIRSGSVSLWIETQAWLRDTQYRRSWPTRVRPNSEETPGFQLLIGGTPELLVKIREALTWTARTSYDPKFPGLCMHLGAAQGYDGLLAVFLDEEPIQTALPAWLAISEAADMATTYQGNLLRIKLAPEGPKGVTVNWYGQLIHAREPLGDMLPYQAYLEVCSGQPVHPMAPSRRGLIRDSSLTDLAHFIQDTIFTHILAQEKPSARAIQQLYALNPDRACQECPFLVVQRHWPLSHPDKIGSLDAARRREYNVPVSVVRRDRLPQLLFLADEIQVYRQVKPLLAEKEMPPSWEAEEFAYGLWSFLAAANVVAYRALSPMVLPDGLERVLWWKPGPFEDKLYTRTPGEWGLGTWDTPPEQWQSLPVDTSVFAFNEAVSWSIDESEALIGTADIAQFLSSWARIFWTRDWEESDRSEEAYDASVGELVASYLPQTVQRSLTLWELPHALCSLFSAYATQPADVRSVDFVFTDRVLNGLTVHFVGGQTEQVTLYPLWKPASGGGSGETTVKEERQA